MFLRAALVAGLSTLSLAGATGARADSLAIKSPHFVYEAGDSSTTLGGQTFTNHGLVGTARLAADLHDFNGETLGSFSSLALDLTQWKRAVDGSYTGVLYTLPDRGPNGVGGLATTNYAARLNRFQIKFKPYQGRTALPATVQQARLTQSGGMLLRDASGQVFTGRDPQDGVVVRDDIGYPVPPAGDPGAGHISMDPEGLARLPDGSFYVSDEYGALIYYFDKTGRQIGAIAAGPDIQPMVKGRINFNGANDQPLVPGSTGRRSNQGLEGVAVSPDGKRLFTLLQSAVLQDNPTNQAARRNNTRLVVYDISASRTPKAPLAEYIMQLPVYGGGEKGPATATAAQSEIQALNETQLLVLSRDNTGRGGGKTDAMTFKSVLLVDTSDATNIAGTPFVTAAKPASVSAAANGSGALDPAIIPAQQTELVNLLNATQLGKFGLNTITTPSNPHTLSEKWESMGLAPTLEKGRPNDFFLFIGNDNDFISHKIDAAGFTDQDTSLKSDKAGVGDNDNVMLIYRVTLPTYGPHPMAAKDQPPHRKATQAGSR